MIFLWLSVGLFGFYLTLFPNPVTISSYNLWH